MTRTQKSAKNTVFAMLLVLITEIGNFIVKTIIVKKLGVEYSGISTLFTDVLNILSLTELGFTTATAFALYRPLHEKDEQHIASLMGYYRKIYFIIAGIVFALGLVFAPFIHNIVKNVPDIKENIVIIFMLFVARSAVSYLFIYKSILLEANQEKNLVSIVAVITTVVFSGLEIAGLFIFKDYILYLILTISAIFVKNLIVSTIASKKFPFLKTQKPDPVTPDEKKGLRRNVGALSLYKACEVLQGAIDSIVISSMIGTASVGYLANYQMVRRNIYSIFGQVIEAAQPSIGNLAVSENRDTQYSVYKRLNMLSFLIANFATVSNFVLVEPFVIVWLGKDFVLGTGIPAILSANLYIIFMMSVYDGFRNANALFSKGKYRPVVMTFLNILLSVLFCKLWGIFGVLAATVLARLLTHVWYDPWLINRHLFHRSFAKYLFVKIVAAAIVIIECFMLKKFTQIIITDSPWLNLILDAFVCLVVPNVIALLVVFRTKEFKELLKSLRKIIISFNHKKEQSKNESSQ